MTKFGRASGTALEILLKVVGKYIGFVPNAIASVLLGVSI